MRAAAVIRFSRVYHGKAFRFLTLTSTDDQTDGVMRERLASLVRYLRRFQKRLDYLATRTDEGNGVYHLVIISSAFLPIKRISEFWGARCWIEKEHDLNGLLLEMVLQREQQRYSMSRGFVPDGAREALEALSRQFRGHVGQVALQMLARRWKQGNALQVTRECCSRKPGAGWCSDLRTRREYLGGRG